MKSSVINSTSDCVLRLVLAVLVSCPAFVWQGALAQTPSTPGAPGVAASSGFSNSKSSSNSKSISSAAASPLAPPLKPMMDTSTSTKPKPTPATSTPPTAASQTPSPFAKPPSSAPGTTPAYGAPPAPSAYGAPPPSYGTSPTNQIPGQPPPPGGDNYPVIGTLETSMFGAATPSLGIDERLGKLETAVYKKTFSTETLFDRTERLKATLLGMPSPEAPDPLVFPGSTSHFMDSAGLQSQSYFDGIASMPENQVEATPEDVQHYFFELLNAERLKFGYGALAPDEVAQKLAKEHVSELCSRHVLSHQDSKGNNPDRRYTLAGGNDLLYESLVSIQPPTTSGKLTRAAAANLLKTIMNRQDEREALMSADATGLGFYLDWTKDKDKIVACSDVLTRHGVIQPIPNMVQVGDKIEVKGVVMPPFHFEKITIAWEGKPPGMPSTADEVEEALPYFAPLDYSAYAHHSDSDHSGAVTALKTAGIIAAIAGGVFVPPVALAAPIIAMSGSVSEPKPASDIPVKGGVKVDGNAFDGRVTVNHEGKEGLYYITVWASLTKYGKPIAISRRAVLATSADGTGTPAGTNQVAGAESVSAERVNDDGTPADPVETKVKHKHKKHQTLQAQPPQSDPQAQLPPSSSSSSPVSVPQYAQLPSSSQTFPGQQALK